jgi:hypothetical protein
MCCLGRSVHPVYYCNSNKKLYLNYDEKEPTFFNMRQGMGQTLPVRSAGSDETISFEFVALPPGGHN